MHGVHMVYMYTATSTAASYLTELLLHQIRSPARAALVSSSGLATISIYIHIEYDGSVSSSGLATINTYTLSMVEPSPFTIATHPHVPSISHM